MSAFGQPGVYTIKSNPIFTVMNGDEKEIVVLEARLDLRTGGASVDRIGRRGVDLEILRWEAKGHSKLLDSDVAMRMVSRSLPESETSFVQAEGKKRDFPAKARFVIPYEIETRYGKIEGLTGITQGRITNFPPSPTDRFEMVKEEDDSDEPSRGRFRDIGDIGDRIPGLITMGPFKIAPVLCAC